MNKRSAILAATEKLIAERGLYGLSMKVLAQEAGVAAGTIYRYFENKEELLFELLKNIRIEEAAIIFHEFSEQNTPKKRYDRLWRNAFDRRLSNPQRFIVFEILFLLPKESPNNIKPFEFEDDLFLPLFSFYQQGIDDKRFHDWPISTLIVLSFDSAINLAKKVSGQCLQLDEQSLINVRDASWQAIQRNTK